MGKNCHQVVTAHEVGHMFGAAHNEDITSFRPNGNYAFGYHMPGGYVTVMAYTNDAFNKRILYFSSPLLTVHGVKTGTTERDVRRAHVERKAIVSVIGDESGTCLKSIGGSTSTTSTSSPPTCQDVFAPTVCQTLRSLFNCCTWACQVLCRSSCSVC